MLTLHGYWRSSAAYRVRIALNLKGLPYAQQTYDLRKNAQRDPAYLAIAPHGLVPTLQTDDGLLIESLAILEWLEETAPRPPLLPADPRGRATVRAMAALIASDIHPLNNLRVLRELRHRFGVDQAGVDAWAVRWISQGFTALETLIAAHGKGFAHGAAPTLADCFLVPQVYSAERFKVDLQPFPHIRAAADRARALPPVQAAHPERQPDADPA